MDVYLEFGDGRRAARIYHQLGLVMADLGLHSDALEMLLRAATWWRTETGGRPDDAIRIIRQQRSYLPSATYQHVVSDVFPVDIRESLDTAVAVVDES